MRDKDIYYKGLEATYWDAFKNYEEQRINSNEFGKIKNEIYARFGIITSAHSDLCGQCVRCENCPVAYMQNYESEFIVGCRFFKEKKNDKG